MSFFTTLDIATVICFVIAVILMIIFLIQGPPFVSSDDETTTELVSLVKKYKGKRVIDLGSGDGKLVIALAKAGITTHGIEINPILVLRSQRRIKQLGLTNKADIHWGNFWSVDLSCYDIVVLYGIKHIMQKLGEKLEKELPDNAHIITNFFIFPQWKPFSSRNRLRTYRLKKKRSS